MGKQIENDFVLKYVAMIFATCFVYANLRYVVFGPEDGTHVPLFILNKALSWSGLATIGLSKVLRQYETSRIAGLLGALMIGMHVVISLYHPTPRVSWQVFQQCRWHAYDLERRGFNSCRCARFGMSDLPSLEHSNSI